MLLKGSRLTTMNGCGSLLVHGAGTGLAKALCFLQAPVPCLSGITLLEFLTSVGTGSKQFGWQNPEFNKAPDATALSDCVLLKLAHKYCGHCSFVFRCNSLGQGSVLSWCTFLL